MKPQKSYRLIYHSVCTNTCTVDIISFHVISSRMGIISHKSKLALKRQQKKKIKLKPTREQNTTVIYLTYFFFIWALFKKTSTPKLTFNLYVNRHLRLHFPYKVENYGRIAILLPSLQPISFNKFFTQINHFPLSSFVQAGEFRRQFSFLFRLKIFILIIPIDVCLNSFKVNSHLRFNFEKSTGTYKQ